VHEQKFRTLDDVDVKGKRVLCCESSKRAEENGASPTPPGLGACPNPITEAFRQGGGRGDLLAFRPAQGARNAKDR